MEPILKKIRVVQPYIVHPDTKQIYGFYTVLAKWPDGRRMYFNSEEEARAYIESRKVDSSKLAKEVPGGLSEVLADIKKKMYKDKGSEEKTETKKELFDIVLTSYGASRPRAIKAVRDITQLKLMEAKDLVDNIPSVIREQVYIDEAENIKEQFEKAGAVVELR